MKRVMRLKIVGRETQSPVLMGLVESPKSPDTLRVFVGGMPSGDVGAQYLRQVGDGERCSVAVKFHRFKDTGKIRSMAELADVEVDDLRTAKEYARLNQSYVISPSALRQEAIMLLTEVLNSTEFSGMAPYVTAHSYGGYAVATSLGELGKTGALSRIAERGGHITLLAPTLLHPDIQEKWETPEMTPSLINRIRKLSLYASVVTSGKWNADLSGEMSRFWKVEEGATKVNAANIPRNLKLYVMISDADEYIGVANKIELVQSMRQAGVGAELVLLTAGEGVGIEEMPGMRIITLRPATRDLYASILHESYHDLYPVFALNCDALDVF